MTQPKSPEEPITLGSLWEIQTKADRVRVVRPNGEAVTVAAFDGVAGHVLDVAGDYSADVDGKTITVQAV